MEAIFIVYSTKDLLLPQGVQALSTRGMATSWALLWATISWMWKLLQWLILSFLSCTRVLVVRLLFGSMREIFPEGETLSTAPSRPTTQLHSVKSRYLRDNCEDDRGYQCRCHICNHMGGKYTVFLYLVPLLHRTEGAFFPLSFFFFFKINRP